MRRSFATGIAGFSHVVDSLCAIKYALDGIALPTPEQIARAREILGA